MHPDVLTAVPDITLLKALSAFVVCFLAETLAVFGGGGFIIQPALLAMGIPPHLAVAHDASAAAGASAGSYFVFHRKGKIDYSLLAWWVPGMVLGPFIGIALLSILSPALLEKLIIVFSLVGATLVLFKTKNWGITRGERLPHWRSAAVLSSFGLGIWAGFSGMGTGTISMFMLLFIFGQTMKEAAATKKPIHLLSETIVALVFLWKGWLLWQLFLPMLAGCLLAGYVGAHLVLRLPEKLLKTIFLASVFLFSALALWRQ